MGHDVQKHHLFCDLGVFGFVFFFGFIAIESLEAADSNE
jgi:hypothetical protein